MVLKQILVEVLCASFKTIKLPRGNYQISSSLRNTPLVLLCTTKKISCAQKSPRLAFRIVYAHQFDLERLK